MKFNIFKSGKKCFNYVDSSIGEFSYILIENLLLALLSFIIILGVPKFYFLNYIFSFLIEIGFLCAVLLSAKFSKTSVFYATKLNVKINFMQSLLILAISVIAIFGFSPITSSFSDFLTNIGYTSSSSIDVNTWGKYILFVFLMAIVPAFCEEVLFRGLIYNGLKKWNSMGAVFISSLFFMLMHGSPDQTVHQFLLGIILALLVDATGSLWASILLHFFNNFIALTINFIYSQISVDTVLESAKVPWGEWALYTFYSICITVAAAWVIWLIISKIKRDNLSKQKDNNVNIENKTVSDAGTLQNYSAESSVDIVLDPNTKLPKFPENYVFDRSKKLSITLFSLSGVWLVLEWILALINGL